MRTEITVGDIAFIYCDPTSALADFAEMKLSLPGFSERDATRILSRGDVRLVLLADTWKQLSVRWLPYYLVWLDETDPRAIDRAVLDATWTDVAFKNTLFTRPVRVWCRDCDDITCEGLICHFNDFPYLGKDGLVREKLALLNRLGPQSRCPKCRYHLTLPVARFL